MVPEWVLDADIGDCALRLYAVLLRYGNTTGARMPARTTLAVRLHKKSTDTVDRALAELVHLGAVQVHHRWAGRQRLTNQYRIRTSRPHGRTSHPRRHRRLKTRGRPQRCGYPTSRSRRSGYPDQRGQGWPYESDQGGRTNQA